MSRVSQSPNSTPPTNAQPSGPNRRPGSGKNRPPGQGAPDSSSDRGLPERSARPTEPPAIAPSAPEASPTSRDHDADHDPSEPGGFWPVLRNRNFLTLWGGQVFSQIADKVYLVMAIALIASHYQQPDQAISGWVSAITIAFTIPAVLFGSVAGVYVDRWSKKAVLVATNLARGLLVWTVPLVVLLGDRGPSLTLLGHPIPFGFFLLLAVTFGVSTLTQYFAPAEQAAIPLIVPRRHLLSANSLYTTTMMASVIIGFAIGEPVLALANHLVASLGGGADLGQELLVGGSYAIAGSLLLLLKTGETQHLERQEFPHILDDLRDGLRYLSGKPLIRNALIQLTILFSIFAALAVLAVRLAELIPALKASQFGVLLAAGGVGMAIGATLLGQFATRYPFARLALGGSIGVGAALATLAATTTHLWATIAAIIALGIAAAFVGIPMQTTIQRETPEAMRGKVFGLQNNAVNIALSLPLALASVAETWFGLPAVFLGLAALAIAGGVATWYISVTGSGSSET